MTRPQFLALLCPIPEELDLHDLQIVLPEGAPKDPARLRVDGQLSCEDVHARGRLLTWIDPDRPGGGRVEVIGNARETPRDPMPNPRPAIRFPVRDHDGTDRLIDIPIPDVVLRIVTAGDRLEDGTSTFDAICLAFLVSTLISIRRQVTRV